MVESGDRFVISYLPYFRQRLICCLLSASYFCRLWLLKCCMESFPSLPSLVHSKHPTLSAVCPFQFLLYYSVFKFFVGQELVCPGDYDGLSQGWLWEYHLPLICSPVVLHLPSRFGAGVWQDRSPPGFSVLHGMEKLRVDCGFRVWEFCLFWLVFSFLPSVAPASEQEFWFTDLTLSASSL
jgi:hypothetical protein